MAIRGNWQEVDPQVESIMAVDFIWKPFNFMKNVTITFFFDFFIIQGFELFDKRKDDIKRSVICYNHYEYISVLSTKTGLLQSLTDYYSNNKMAIDCNYTVADSLPMAFMITSNPNDFDFQVFRKKFQNIERGYVYKEKLAPKQFEQNFWLLKPANMNQGKGIEIFNTLKQIYSFLANKPQDQLWIVQKYIEKPLLYKQRKFDIRVLALGTNDYEIYFYNTGYMRTSSDNYTLDNKNKFVHLTNNCYQKHSNNYQKFEQGNQLTFQQFQEYLKDTFPDLEIPFDQIMLRMKDLIIDCFLAGINNFNPNKREHVFEVMGFDFMIDEDFRVWIIEVNTNPYFGVLNDQLPKFIDNLVDDTLRLTLDKVFPRDNPDSERPSQYELLYSQKQGINKRQGFDVGIYPVKSIKDKLDQERDLTLQKLNQLRSEQSQVLLLKQQTLQHKNLKTSDQKSTNKQNDELDVLNNNETSFKNLRKSQDSHQMTKIDELNEYKSQKITQSTMNTNDYLTNQNMHATVSKRTHQQPIGATSISVLLRKKAEEATRISQINQNDHLTKIQRILKVKDLIEQIKDSVSSIGDNVEQRKKDFNKYFNQICSALSNSSNVISNSKHYIPGETKEIEQLRRKAIQNGVLILVDVLYQISPEKQIKDKVKFDILDNLDLNDKKLHIYTVYEHFRQKVSYSQESQMSMRDSRLQLSQENKENITQKLAEISQRSMFQRIQDYIETNFKQVNPRIPSVLSQMDEHFNIKYLSDILDKYEQQINGNQSKLQQDTILPTVSGSKNLRNSPDFRKTMINNDSQESLERINIKKSSHQKQALNGKSVRNTIDGSYKSKQSRKEDRDIKSQESRESVQEYQRNQNNNVLMANQTYFANQDYISTANDLREYKSKMPINDTHRNTQYNVKSFERIKQSMRDVDILKRPLKQSKEKKVKSLRTQLNSKNRLPQLSDGTSEKEENNSMQYQNGYLTSKDHSLVLPNLANQQALESHNKKQLLYYGIGTNFQNQGGYNKVLQDANYYLKLHPYLQNNVRTSKNSNKKSFAHSVVKNDYQNLMHNQSSTVLFNQSKQDVKQSNPSILPLSQNTMKSNYYKSGYMSKIKISIESKVYSNQKMGLKSVPLSQKSYGTGKNQSQIQSDAGSEMKSERYLDIMPTSVNEEITN
eukprot:403375852